MDTWVGGWMGSVILSTTKTQHICHLCCEVFPDSVSERPLGQKRTRGWNEAGCLPAPGRGLLPPLPLSREPWWRCSGSRLSGTCSLGLFSHFTSPAFWPDAELPLGLSQRDFIPNPSWFAEAFTKGNEEESLPTGQSMALCAPRLWQFF